jgi:hypothetical protein
MPVKSSSSAILRQYLLHVMARQPSPLSARARTGQARVPRVEPAPIATHATMWPLATQGDWNALNRAYIEKRQGNLKPWFRCLSVLRELGALTAVSEDYYVCLDYRSEFASFYAHIDAPRHSNASRLHFFGTEISAAKITDLTPEQADSYLGYIVCREGDLPLVARTVIEKPPYIDDCTAIREPVNFFGQKLEVHGVPFMQQDERFAVCAHVATWVIHYSAFRRGIQERRHIADLVGMAGPILPLRPRTSDGLTENQVAQILDGLGFKAVLRLTPTVDDRSFIRSSLPDVKAEELPENVIAILRKAGLPLLGASGKAQPDKSVVEQLEAKLEDYFDEMQSDDGTDRSHSGEPVVDAVHQLIDYLIYPYLRSGWPIYAGAGSHAFAICGRSWVRDRPVHFVQDDQNGPYLLASLLPAISRESLNRQSGYVRRHRDTAPERDVVKAMLNGEPEPGHDARRGIDSIITAVPPRVLLSPSAANQAARSALNSAKMPDWLDRVAQQERDLLEQALLTRVSIVMGVDYKAYRRHCALDRDDSDGVLVYSSLQLAEWIVLVEALTDGDASFAEFAYDASSSDANPRLQFARVFTEAVTARPLDETELECRTLSQAYYPLVVIPQRAGSMVSQ